MCTLSSKEFKKFLELNPVLLGDGSPEPCDAYQFAKKLGLDDQTIQAYKLSNAIGPINRSELRQRCDLVKSDDEILGAILSILAWGGMSHGNPGKFWSKTNCAEPLIRIIHEMRCTDQNIDPVDAFMLFHKAWSKNDLPYMGISFYTKILFFFFPGSSEIEAPIIDQFVAKSLDVLFCTDSKHPNFLGSDGYPKQYQNSQHARSSYQRYLSCLDTLRQQPELCTQTKFSRSHIEWLLFRRGFWRNYIISVYKNGTIKILYKGDVC
jgi:hypothetical protein